MQVRGKYGFSSLVKQNKKAKICFVIYIAGFFFKFFSVMKCLRSKKRKKSPAITPAASLVPEIILDQSPHRRAASVRCTRGVGALHSRAGMSQS